MMNDKTKNRFKSVANGTRTGTSSVIDVATGQIVIGHLSADMARSWATGLSRDVKSGAKSVTLPDREYTI
jgi:hypothetical protein